MIAEMGRELEMALAPSGKINALQGTPINKDDYTPPKSFDQNISTTPLN